MKIKGVILRSIDVKYLWSLPCKQAVPKFQSAGYAIYALAVYLWGRHTNLILNKRVRQHDLVIIFLRKALADWAPAREKDKILLLFAVCENANAKH